MTSNHPAGTNSAIGFSNSAHLQCEITPVKADHQTRRLVCPNLAVLRELPG